MKTSTDHVSNTVLIAEDDDVTREMLRFIMQSAGYNVLTAADGKITLDEVVNHQPDLVLLDVMMPEVHGYSVCHKIKSDKVLNKIKVVFLTAKSFLADRRQAQSVGGDAFISKPVDPPVILETVGALLAV